MPSLDDLLITVQPDWSDWRTAQVRFRDLDEVAWLQPPGAPRPLIHGYVPCSQVASGTLAHDCDGRASHRVLVCVLKSHNTSSAYAALSQVADQGGVRRSIDAAQPIEPWRARGGVRPRALLLTVAAIALGVGAYGWHRAHATGHGG